MVRFPLGKTGFRKTIEGRAETDYLVAMLTKSFGDLPEEATMRRDLDAARKRCLAAAEAALARLP